MTKEEVFIFPLKYRVESLNVVGSVELDQRLSSF